MELRNVALGAERLRSLADPGSCYFKTVGQILQNGAITQRRADESRVKVVLPMAVTTEYRVELERKFGWKLEVKDYGVRGRLPAEVEALAYLMGLRNVMLMGADGEEAICLDGDLPAMVAKGLSYGHVCRTHATSRLAGSYEFEAQQLSQLAHSGGPSVAGSAKAVLDSMVSGDCTRVCENAALCTRGADTILVNHVRTPVSLAQVVATARAHKASVVRGVCFFQPEMLYSQVGELQAFPGKFIVERDADVINFLPRSDSSMGFSHPYSSLMSFFINHEYCEAGESWLVEKHLSGDGIFHYIVKKEGIEVSLSEELSANYYKADLTRWIELSYMSFFDEESGVPLRVPKRVTTSILESVYEKVMPILLSINVKRLTFDEVFSQLRNHNNMVFSGGDTVRKPRRVAYDDLHRAVVPMLALAMVRREAAAFELRVALPMVRKRFGVQDMSLVAVMWSALCSKVSGLATVAMAAATSDDLVSLDKLEFQGVDHSVRVVKPGEYVSVTHMSGAKRPFLYGRMEAWLPGKNVRSLSLLARARAIVAAKCTVSVHSSVESSNKSVASDERAKLGSDMSLLQADGSVGGTVSEPVPVAVLSQDESVASVELVGEKARLAEKLMAQQDALSIGRPPRLVESFEGAERIDVDVTPLLETDPVAVGQEDYDTMFPGVSQSDEEVKPYMAVESDFEKHADFVGTINDAKRVLPGPKAIRRSRIRTGGGGQLPRCQAATMAALFKRNVGIPANRGFVNLDVVPGRVIDAITEACYVDGWRDILARELDAGLWQPIETDIMDYVPKVPSHQVSVMMNEFVTTSDENLSRWLLMVKATAKPPMDPGAASKVQLPQTIMYSDQKTVNAKYSAMHTRFYKAMRAMLKPNISFNNRDSPAQHEVWFNSCQGIRDTTERIWAFEGDLFCYDRSQEHVAQVMELLFYKRHGLDAETLQRWSVTHGPKKATSMMFGIVLWITMQGLSGIWKTLFRNGLVCLGAVVYCSGLTSSDIVTMDIVGDDFAVEANRPVAVSRVVEGFALTFNLTAKLFGSHVMYMCSKYWIRVGNWWYYVQDPIRKFESVSNAVISNGDSSDKLSEKWVSLRDDLRHYDNALVMEALGEAVRIRLGSRIIPMGLIRSLATFAASKKDYVDSYGPEVIIG